MREILFRGKRTDNGEWIEGYYCNLGGNHPRVLKESIFIGKIGRVLEFKNIDVIPETVGQYTGLTDKNGKKIFEGDIVITKTTSCKFVGCILYSTEYVRFVCVTKSKMSYPMDSKFEYEIIGNIHDNPELFETAAKPAAKNIAQSGLAPATENFELMEG